MHATNDERISMKKLIEFFLFRLNFIFIFRWIWYNTEFNVDVKILMTYNSMLMPMVTGG